MRFAYINHTYPQLTQTFVYREVRALRALGLDVVTVSFKRRAYDFRSRELEEETARTTYLPPVRSAAFWRGVLASAIRHPLRAASAVGLFFRRDGNPLARRSAGGFAIDFLRGLYLASYLSRHADIDHAHSPFSTEIATALLVASRITGRRFSFRNHTCYDAALIAEKLAGCSLALSISEFDRDLMLSYSKGRHRDKIAIVHCGIDPSEWPARNELTREPRLLTVGSLAPKKGHGVLIDACGLLAERGVPFHLDIVGDGPLRDALAGQVARLGLAERVTLHGPLPQEAVREFLVRARVLVLASVKTPEGDLDGIPVVLMEGMAAGVPCVSTRLSGIPELIEDGATGLLAEPGDPRDLADKLARILADDDLAGRIAAAAPAKIERDFNQSREAEKLRDLFLSRG